MKALLKTVCASVVLTALIGTAGLAQTSKRQASDQFGFAWGGHGGGYDSPYRAFNAVDPNGVPGRAGRSGRDTALKDCAAQSRKYSQYTWGNMELYQERSCMAEHGQME